MSLVVFKGIFKHTNKYDAGEWKSIGRVTTCDGNALDSLHIRDGRKVYILKLSELSVQVQRQESYNVVFGCADRVTLETFSIQNLLRTAALVNRDNPVVSFINRRV